MMYLGNGKITIKIFMDDIHLTNETILFELFTALILISTFDFNFHYDLLV